ncbi:hypothetical protein IV203_027384 [Nitzschia inconspicua]|uniref:Uncharacterized protein n=1 Tax=Nitzschia inconspicua TaxID=303405 RepID=A0A9K3LW61_9STRA|nr:hypothetical protein IV203_027384 [Nitzschia inconspicua]
MAESDNIGRTVVWPTDIFGDKAYRHDIAQLIPDGKCLNVAAAVLGIQDNEATRGFIPEETSQANPTHHDSTGKYAPKNQKEPRTRVVHFVTNKITLHGQKFSLDSPILLIVPVMTLQQAKDPRGEGCLAICPAGYPRVNPLDVIDASEVYKLIRLIRLVDPDLYSMSDAREMPNQRR